MAEPIVTIALGDPKASNLGGTQARIDHQPVGMDFHERKWPMDRLGRVRYLQGPNSFEVSRVSGVTGSSYRDEPALGIFAWSIRAFPTGDERVPHQVARDELFALLAQMRRAGWRRYLDLSDPRLKGEQALRYCLQEDGNYSLDPDYLPSPDDWMRINRHLPYWHLWANGTYLRLRVMDEPSLRNPERPGVYLFSIDIDSESSNFEQYFTEVEDMRRWKQLIPPEIERLHKLRETTEAVLRTQGYTIDTA